MAGSVSTLNGTIDLGRGAVDSTTYGLSAYGLVQMAENAAFDVMVSYGNVKNSYRRISLDGFSETGGGDASLIIGKGIEKFVTGQIGLRSTLLMRTSIGYVIRCSEVLCRLSGIVV